MELIKSRCGWCGTDPLYVQYHDEEWGVPLYDDRKLFEFVVLEGAQAGLSWITILRRREGYRQAFAEFDPEKVARFGVKDFNRLMGDAGIIRNRAKINSTIKNAQAFLDIQDEFGSFSNYQWCFTDGVPLQNHRKSLKDIPPQTDRSVAFSQDLRNRGFTFVGPTIMYAHMQAVGMVNDHTQDCFRHQEVKKLGLD